MKKLGLLIVFLFIITTISYSQVEIARQYFDGVNNLGYSAVNGTTYLNSSSSSDRPASATYYVSSNTAYGVSNNTATLTFDNVLSLDSYSNKYIEFRLASWSISSTGNGADAGDIVTTEVSTDGGSTWSSELRILGNANAYWHYSTGTGVGSVTYDGNNIPVDFSPASGGNRTTDGYSIVRINLPDAGIQARIRITLLNNSANERWTIDNVRIMGTENATTPTITTSLSSLSNFSYVIGSGPSAEQSFTISGANLTSDISIVPSTNYEISTGSGVSFIATNPILLTPLGGTVDPPISINVRLKSGLSIGDYNGELVTASSTLAPDQTVTCNGTVMPVLPNLFFSEYVEGSSNNKAIEIINISGSDIDLFTDNYLVQIYANGSSTVTNTITLTGTVPNEDVFVLVNSSSSSTLLSLADQTSGALTFNGDDAVVLRVGGVSGNILDVIGQIGFDPGTNWGTDPNSTLDHTLRRKDAIAIGDRNGSDVFDPSTEWNSFNIDDFSDLGNPSLPVELTSFSATTIGKNVKLNWNTATEINNYGFEVERRVGSPQSSVGNYEKIGFVNGNGNSNSPKDYSFVDDKVTNGKYSYRLKQIDNDGQFEYSKTVEVDINAVSKFELSQNYPNPFNPTTTISYILPQAGMVRLTLYNILGQEIRTLVNEMKEAGTHTLNLDASDLNSGMYIYKIESGSFVQTKKMTLVK